jgi:hypothetical protein
MASLGSRVEGARLFVASSLSFKFGQIWANSIEMSEFKTKQKKKRDRNDKLCVCHQSVRLKAQLCHKSYASGAIS